MIDTEALKRKILDLAISGRLTQHVSKDGTSEELIAKIIERRNELTKQKLIKKYIAEPITVIEKPIDIPESWRWVRLGTIASVNGGKRIPAGRKLTTENTGYKYIRVSDLKNYSVNTETIMYVPEDIYPKIQNYTISSKDVYITVAGTIGNVGKVPASLDGANLTENANKIVFDIIDQTWLMYTLDSSLIQKVISSLTTQVAQPKLAIKRIQDFALPFPPVAEQKRIADIIESAFALVDKIAELQQQYTNNINSLNKKILDLAIRGKLVPQDPNDEPASVLLKKIAEEKQKLIKERKIKKQKALPAITEDEIPFDIPESWEWVRFSSIMNVVSTGPFGSMLHKSDYVETGIPIVNPVHMVNRKIVPSTKASVTKETAERLEAYKLHTGDLVLARRGDIGRSAVVSESEEGWLCGTGSFFASPSKGINPEYISLMLFSEYAKGILLGNSVGTTMNNLNQGILNNFIFPLPPTMEQERILNAVQDMDDYLSKIVSINK